MVGINIRTRTVKVSIKLIFTQNKQSKAIYAKITKVNRNENNPPLKSEGNLEKFTFIPFSITKNITATAKIAIEKNTVIC